MTSRATLGGDMLLATPIAAGGLAGTSLSVGDAIAAVTLPAVIALVLVSEVTRRKLEVTRGSGDPPR